MNVARCREENCLRRHHHERLYPEGLFCFHRGGSTIAFSDYLTEKLKPAIDSGVAAIHLEEPEFWDHGGYSPAFQREYLLYYREKWQPPHTGTCC